MDALETTAATTTTTTESNYGLIQEDSDGSITEIPSRDKRDTQPRIPHYVWYIKPHIMSEKTDSSKPKDDQQSDTDRPTEGLNTDSTSDEKSAYAITTINENTKKMDVFCESKETSETSTDVKCYIF